MALRRLIQQNHNANFVGFGASPASAAGGEPALPMDSRRIQHLANTVGTLPRGRKQVRRRSGAPAARRWLAAGVCGGERDRPGVPEGPHRFTAAPDVGVLEGLRPGAFSLAGFGAAVKSLQQQPRGRLRRGASEEAFCLRGLGCVERSRSRCPAPAAVLLHLQQRRESEEALTLRAFL